MSCILHDVARALIGERLHNDLVQSLRKCWILAVHGHPLALPFEITQDLHHEIAGRTVALDDSDQTICERSHTIVIIALLDSQARFEAARLDPLLSVDKASRLVPAAHRESAGEAPSTSVHVEVPPTSR
jgi:hypothetical protein